MNWKVWNHFLVSLCLKINNIVIAGIFLMSLSYSFFRKCELKTCLFYLLLVKETEDVRNTELTDFVGGKGHLILRYLKSLQFYTKRESISSIKTPSEFFILKVNCDHHSIETYLERRCSSYIPYTCICLHPLISFGTSLFSQNHSPGKSL